MPWKEQSSQSGISWKKPTSASKKSHRTDGGIPISYLHIKNLYADNLIQNFKECWALEKIHGTSAHISFEPIALGRGRLHCFPGGENAEEFAVLFNADMLLKLLIEKFGLRKVTIYGEHYGGRIMGMSKTYGDKKRFVVFDIKLGQLGDALEIWMSFDKVKILCHELDLDVVHGVIVPTTVEALDAQRDLPSIQAKKCGIQEDRIREGLVLRPLIECDHYGERIIAKYKRDEFIETSTPRSLDPARLQVLADAKAIAEEWVTDMRLVHVMDKIPHGFTDFSMSAIPAIIKAMLEDVKRESQGEVIWTTDVEKAIAGETGKKMKALLSKKL